MKVYLRSALGDLSEIIGDGIEIGVQFLSVLLSLLLFVGREGIQETRRDDSLNNCCILLLRMSIQKTCGFHYSCYIL